MRLEHGFFLSFQGLLRTGWDVSLNCFKTKVFPLYMRMQLGRQNWCFVSSIKVRRWFRDKAALGRGEWQGQESPNL